jgi:hypothetical protein
MRFLAPELVQDGCKWPSANIFSFGISLKSLPLYFSIFDHVYVYFLALLLCKRYDTL